MPPSIRLFHIIATYFLIFCFRLRNVPKKSLLLKWAEQQRSYQRRVLIVWARDDKLMPPAHAERLAQRFENAELIWVDDSRTLVPIDQPKLLTNHLQAFLAVPSS